MAPRHRLAALACARENVVTKIKLQDTGLQAHVEMGEWDGESFELDSDYPVCRLSDGRYVVLLGEDELPPAPLPSPDHEALKGRRA